MLEEFAKGVWTVSKPLKIAGSEFGTRMTIIRVGEAGLVLIAPCPIDAALERKIRDLGNVEAIIAPNCFHHFYLLDAHALFPDAAVFLAEGVGEKLARMPVGARTLSGEVDSLWAGDLEQIKIGGTPKVNEVVFFHGASQTLVLTDLCFNFNPPPRGWTGFILRIVGAHGRLAASRLMRSMFKDRAAVRASIREILAWDFERLIVTHGSNISSGAKALFEQATRDI